MWKRERKLEHDSAKILLDFSVQTNQNMEHNKPDTITDNKETKEGHIVGVACLLDTQVKEKNKKRWNDTKI